MRGRKGYGFIVLLALLTFSATGAFADGIVWAGNGSDNEGVASGNRVSAKLALDAGRRTVKRTADRLPSPLSSSVAKLGEKIVITKDGAATATRIPVNFDVTNNMTDGDGSTLPSPNLPPISDPDSTPPGPISLDPAEWTLSVGAADAEGLTPVSIETNLYLDAEPTTVRATGEGFTGEVTAELGMDHILSKARVTGEVESDSVSGGRGATAAYLVVFSGKVKSLDAAAITGVFYRVKGSDEKK